MAERRTSTLLRALAICIVTMQLSLSVKSVVAHGARHNQLRMTGDVHADYKTYLKLNPDLKRDSTRFEFFKRNYERILAHDAEKAGYSLGLTKFTGYTDEELAMMRNNRLNDAASPTDEITGNSIVYFNPTNENMGHVVRTIDEKDIPTNFSWVDKGKVSSVKDQGKCGSCYTFAATAAAESAYAIHSTSGQLFDFAPQQYVSCTTGLYVQSKLVRQCNATGCYRVMMDAFVNGTTAGNLGCDGGDFITCWYYHNVTGKPLNLESCYPYTSGRRGKVADCSMPDKCSMQLDICGYLRVAANDSAALKSAILNNGPAACKIIVGDNLNHYTGGIYNGARGVTDHAVTVVGFAQTSTGTNFWIVKNSWGDSWGLKGYVWINGDDVNDASITSSCGVPILCNQDEDSSSSD